MPKPAWVISLLSPTSTRDWIVAEAKRFAGIVPVNWFWFRNTPPMFGKATVSGMIPVRRFPVGIRLGCHYQAAKSSLYQHSNLPRKSRANRDCRLDKNAAGMVPFKLLPGKATASTAPGLKQSSEDGSLLVLSQHRTPAH